MDVHVHVNIKSKWRRLDAYSALIACRSVRCAVRGRVLTMTPDT